MVANVSPSLIVWSGMPLTTGGSLTAVTVIVVVAVTLVVLSKTPTVMVKMPLSVQM